MVQIYRTHLDGGIASCTDGVDIWIDDRLNEVQERCAIAHEMVHVEMGHTRAQSEPVELAVRFETALRLLPPGTPALCKGSRSLGSAARALGVTKQVLMDRAAVATAEEVEVAGCVECRLCPVIAARFAPRRVLVA